MWNTEISAFSAIIDSINNFKTKPNLWVVARSICCQFFPLRLAKCRAKGKKVSRYLLSRRQTKKILKLPETDKHAEMSFRNFTSLFRWNSKISRLRRRAYLKSQWARRTLLLLGTFASINKDEPRRRATVEKRFFFGVWIHWLEFPCETRFKFTVCWQQSANNAEKYWKLK